ncbi:hypothetical protein [uncultured Anaerococcus sp.]|uniref:hypothetical protein n=1 Tax=uncultured Anaerococcus sp. TaxID=293428 RepID=UPI00288B4511|nr:hypothetical protein [uncultured Anaerococcus sp.]
MKKFRIKDITFMAISIALMYVFGYLLYIMSRFFPIPGSRVIFTTPLFTFVLTAAVLKTKKIGTISIIMGLLALILLRLSVFGALAVGLTGILTDLTSLILIRTYTDYRSIYRTLAFHSFYSIWTSYFLVSLFIENSTFVMGNIFTVFLVSIILYFLAYYIAKLTIKLFDARKLLDNKTYTFKD